ncbi:MAG: zinc-ribbon domain-containing protein, partial [Caulobacterales bacterium]
MHFENTSCIACGRRLGYIASKFAMIAVEPASGWWESATQRGLGFKFCGNWEAYACNWLLMADDPERFCQACRHNRVVPDLTVPGNDLKWQKLELAKRFLFYSLMRWR